MSRRSLRRNPEEGYEFRSTFGKDAPSFEDPEDEDRYAHVPHWKPGQSLFGSVPQYPSIFGEPSPYQSQYGLHAGTTTATTAPRRSTRNRSSSVHQGSHFGHVELNEPMFGKVEPQGKTGARTYEDEEESFYGSKVYGQRDRDDDRPYRHERGRHHRPGHRF